MALFQTLVLPARGSVLQTLFFFFAWAGRDPRCPWLQSRLLACRRRALAPAILAAACGRPALRFGLSRFLSASCLHCGIYMFPLRSCSLIRSVTLCVDCFLDIWFRGVCSSEHLRFILDWTVFSLWPNFGGLGNFRFCMSGNHARGNRHRLLVLCFALTSLLGAGAQLCRIQRNFCVCSHPIFVFVPVVVHRVLAGRLPYGLTLYGHTCCSDVTVHFVDANRTQMSLSNLYVSSSLLSSSCLRLTGSLRVDCHTA